MTQDKKGAPKSSEPIPTSKEEEIDIDLNDPEVNAAAVKIQAGFKGHKTRQQLKEKKVRVIEGHDHIFLFGERISYHH